MPLKPKPIVGHWYETSDSLSFKVISIDLAGKTLEIQFPDSTHDEISFNAWNAWEVDSIVPPSDWEDLYDEEFDDLTDDIHIK